MIFILFQIIDEVKIYSHIPGKRKAPEPPKRNGGAYYARIAKAMSPKINRPALSNATGVSSTEKGSGTTSVPFNELQKEKSPQRKSYIEITIPCFCICVSM